jgi:DNA polymerase-3 subunit gamma/tau
MPVLPISGVTKSIAMNCALLAADSATIHLVLNEDYATLYNENQRERISSGLSEFFATSITLVIDVGRVHYETPAQRNERIKIEKQGHAEAWIANDPKVAMLLSAFAGTVVAGSIAPNE